MTDKLIKMKQAADQLTLSRSTFYNLILAGKISRVMVSEGRFAIKQSELDRYLEELKWITTDTY